MRTKLHPILLEGLGAFAAALALLMTLAPAAPFVGELGVCESGAVRDVLAGNLVLPHFIPGPMVHVPPLYWWTAALGVRVLGWSEIALRMPAILAAAMTCAIVFVWGSIAFGRRAALMATAALLFCHFFLDAARQPRMDSMLALFVTAAAMLLERALRPPPADPPSADATGTAEARKSRRAAFALAALMIGLGILTKGVLGILLPGIAAGLYLLWRMRLRDMFRLNLIVTFTAGLAIGLAWYVAAYAEGGAKFLQWQLAMNLWSRFLPTDAGGAGYCAHPFWYFVPHTITGFIPWSAYLPAIAIYVWPRRGRALPEPVVYTLCWFAAIFIFFSSSQGKCLVYILPAFPPLAMLTGIASDAAARAIARTPTMLAPGGLDFAPPLDTDTARSGDRALAMAFTAANAAIAAGAIAIVVCAAIIVIAGIPASLAAHLHQTDRRFVGIFAALAAHRDFPLLAWIAASAAGAAIVLSGIVRRRPDRALTGVCAIATAGAIFWFAVMNPALADRETLRGFARAVTRTVPPGAAVAHLGLSDCDLNFYSPRPLTPIYHLQCAGADAPRYVVARARDFAAANPAARACFATILTSPPLDNNGARILLERVAPPR
ncbi:MAG TPA: glycosyltransferase family 39 protein [Candidatus Binataceae bacterium]|nr:glycosyltransferase family 39 protein [Candidatus Binataceae bacterium]